MKVKDKIILVNFSSLSIDDFLVEKGLHDEYKEWSQEHLLYSDSLPDL